MNDEPATAKPDAHTGPKKASLLRVAWIVVSGLVMIGRNRDFGPDSPRIGPIQLIVVALIGAGLLIASLVFLASSIVK